MILKDPIPVTLDFDTQKLSGFIMKLTLTGIMVELDKIPFKAGAYLTAQFNLSPSHVFSERVRVVKNYSQYYRKAPPKKPKPGEVLPTPKMLTELHFQNLIETQRVLLNKYLIMKKMKSSL